jgi:hypothetical protein
LVHRFLQLLDVISRVVLRHGRAAYDEQAEKQRKCEYVPPVIHAESGKTSAKVQKTLNF